MGQPLALLSLNRGIEGLADVPANGQITNPASFQLVLGNQPPVSLAIIADSENRTRADLVDDLNTALGASTLAGKVIASLNGGKLLLSTTALASAESLELAATADNPAVTQLHLPTSLKLAPGAAYASQRTTLGGDLGLQDLLQRSLQSRIDSYFQTESDPTVSGLAGFLDGYHLNLP